MSYNEPIVLEYNSDFYKDYKTITSSQEPDELQEKFRHFDYRKELMALLSLVGSANFYKEKSYLLNNKKLGEAYFKADFSNNDLGNKLEINNKCMAQGTNFVFDLICFPDNCDQFFTNYFSLNKENISRFRMSLMLYYNSIYIREYSASMSYIALISSIENMVDFEGNSIGFKPETCSSCSQPKYKLNRRFKDFMIKYCGDDSVEFERHLGRAYAKRSSIAHLGELFYNDHAKTELDISGETKLDNLRMIVRIALYNWIINATNA